MVQRLDFAWRLFATGLSFSVFGVGGMVLGLLVFPLVHLLSKERDRANQRCQYLVHLAFRLFIWMMRTLGVLTYDIVGEDKLRRSDAKLVVVNHPSLIDVVFVIAMLPQTLCVVKKAAWSNPVMAGVMWATGYIPNDDALQFIEDCVQSLEDGHRLVIFPEGTRAVPGEPMKLKRGAASIIVMSGQPFVPIYITSDPTTLTKAEKWYQIPKRRVHFRIVIGDNLDPRPMIVSGERLSRATGRINQLLQEVLSGDVEQHEHAG